MKSLIKTISMLLVLGIIAIVTTDTSFGRGARRGGTVIHKGDNGTVVHRGTPRHGTTVGKRVVTLPSGAETVVVRGHTYHRHAGIWYRPYYEGTTVVYVIVEDPEEEDD